MVWAKECRICHKHFTTPQPHTVYCPECHGQAKNALASRIYRQKHSHPCLDCGKPVSPKAERCRSCSHTQFGKEHRRESNPHWKGGKGYDSNGYIRLLKKDHPRAINGYIYEHLAVWEDANGELPKGYIIHHLNGIKHDNRLSNLMAVQRGQHHFALYLQSLQKHIRDLEAQLAQQTLPS